MSTTLHCAGCVESIKPFFDASPKIKTWKVDLKPPVKTITAEGEALNENDIVELLRQGGYDKLEATSVVSSELPEIANAVNETGFWRDRKLWKRASFNTLNCLLGCSIGDFGMLIFLQAFYPGTSMFVQMVLAIIAGLCTSIVLETIILRVRENFNWRLAFTTAISMSFISMVTMEVAMNLSDFMVTGGKAAFDNPNYWLAFVVALLAGFITPLPYNYYKLKRYNLACH